jgi:hypothetical protein
VLLASYSNCSIFSAEIRGPRFFQFGRTSEDPVRVAPYVISALAPFIQCGRNGDTEGVRSGREGADGEEASGATWESRSRGAVPKEADERRLCGPRSRNVKALVYFSGERSPKKSRAFFKDVGPRAEVARICPALDFADLSNPAAGEEEDADGQRSQPLRSLSCAKC